MTRRAHCHTRYQGMSLLHHLHMRAKQAVKLDYIFGGFFYIHYDLFIKPIRINIAGPTEYPRLASSPNMRQHLSVSTSNTSLILHLLQKRPQIKPHQPRLLPSPPNLPVNNLQYTPEMTLKSLLKVNKQFLTTAGRRRQMTQPL